MNPSDLTLGAYAAAGTLDQAEEREWYELLSGLSAVRGLEAPFSHSGLHAAAGVQRFAALLPADWHVVITLLPMTFAIGKDDGRYGLASTDADGRARAVRDAMRARETVLRLDDLLGRPVVTAVQLHSAPSRARADASNAMMLQQSLEELVQQPWNGASLLLEHCDAAAANSDWQKGFLALGEETRAVVAAGGPAAGLGQSINWGRSVIEGRSAARALDHLSAVIASGTLRGVMFSGAAATDGPYGDAWRDVHNPSSTVDPQSLLTTDRIVEALALLGDRAPGLPCFIGAKVKAHPGATNPTERLVSIRATVADIVRAGEIVERQLAGSASLGVR